MGPQFTYDELKAIWEALGQCIDNADTENDEPIGIEHAQTAHDKLEAFLVTLWESRFATTPVGEGGDR